MPKLSREVGDKAELTDAMFNFVAGSCFEMGLSLVLLDRPGEAGLIVDEYVMGVKTIIDTIYNTPLGEHEIRLSPTQEPIKLKEYINTKILQEFSPLSDQIGRCLDMSKKEDWFSGEGLRWLSTQLKMSSALPEHTYHHTLTKIKALAAFGSALLGLMKDNKDIIALITERAPELITERIDEYSEKIVHADFNNPDTRARTEKMPLIEGRPLSADEHDIDAVLVDAATTGPEFGQIWHVSGMKPKKETGPGVESIAKYAALERIKGRQGMQRLGQDIQDISRPGLLGESSLAMIPSAFKETDLDTLMASHPFDHGSGLNRWRLHGSYALDSWNHSLPAAGAHSRVTANIFLVINCLDADSIFGNPKAKAIGLLISSFLNFGGYHSLVETYPIAQAVAANEKFSVKVTPKQKGLYDEMMDVAKTRATGAYEHAQSYSRAYHQSIKDMMKVETKGKRKTSSMEALDLAKPKSLDSAKGVKQHEASAAAEGHGLGAVGDFKDRLSDLVKGTEKKTRISPK